MTLMKKKSPKHTHALHDPTKFQSLGCLNSQKCSVDGKTPTDTSPSSLLFALFYFFPLFFLSLSFPLAIFNLCVKLIFSVY